MKNDNPVEKAVLVESAIMCPTCGDHAVVCAASGEEYMILGITTDKQLRKKIPRDSIVILRRTEFDYDGADAWRGEFERAWQLVEE